MSRRPRTRVPKGRARDLDDRRKTTDILLGRMLRGVLTPTEAALLAQHVREEQRSADENRHAMAGTTQALARHREAADAAIQEWEQRAADAEEQFRAYRAVEAYRAAVADTFAGRLDAIRQQTAEGIVTGIEHLQQRAEQAEQRADTYRAAWHSARDRARKHAAEERRVRGWLGHWADRARAAEPRAERYRTAWFAARRDRRAAMARELPIVHTAQQALGLDALTAAEAADRLAQWAAAGIPAAQFVTTTEQP
ncbi:hypothetical protein QA943_18745 [Streptomyces sp. B21-097]|uniref:hypothetical protein n=1 Tax=Streptomyces sp. B21-097 TaxID=3039414 RepID=UPI002FF1A80B